ncbi:MAG TPA: 1,2-phenylacetyl-CoA epoxidase subunit PaaD [Casimicrobiaceae bacterium]
MTSALSTPEARGAKADGCASSEAAALWRALGRVVDPEIPLVSIVELGIVRGVEQVRGEWVITLTPTYSGCPATRVIETDVRAAVASVTGRTVRIVTALAPPWSSDWIAPEARRKLHGAGIAPPQIVGGRDATQPIALRRSDAVRCPNCGSLRTSELARFGSTACKAQWRCADCLEPFDHFKPH